MKKYALIVFVVLLSIAPLQTITSDPVNSRLFTFYNDIFVYKRAKLDAAGLDFKVFEIALQGYRRLRKDGLINNDRYLTIADFSKASVQKRLFVIDIKRAQVVFQTYVAHGKNSGELYAGHFSNAMSSNQSSLGFYLTGNEYQGKHGLSLRLQGLEPGFNDMAEERAIVVHGADYVSEEFIKSTGRLGRSFGCPAVATSLAAPVINTIGNGSCFLVYFPDPEYMEASAFIDR